MFQLNKRLLYTIIVAVVVARVVSIAFDYAVAQLKQT